MAPTLLNLAEAAEALRISKSYLYKLTCGRQIPFVKIGSRVTFLAGDLDEWLAARRVAPSYEARRT